MDECHSLSGSSSSSSSFSSSSCPLTPNPHHDIHLPSSLPSSPSSLASSFRRLSSSDASLSLSGSTPTVATGASEGGREGGREGSSSKRLETISQKDADEEEHEEEEEQEQGEGGREGGVLLARKTGRATTGKSSVMTLLIATVVKGKPTEVRGEGGRAGGREGGRDEDTYPHIISPPPSLFPSLPRMNG